MNKGIAHTDNTAGAMCKKLALQPVASRRPSKRARNAVSQLARLQKEANKGSQVRFPGARKRHVIFLSDRADCGTAGKPEIQVV